MNALHSPLKQVFAVITLAAGMAACSEGEQSNSLHLASFDTPISRSQAEARVAEREAALAALRAQRARQAAPIASRENDVNAAEMRDDDIITAMIRTRLQRQGTLRGQPIQLYTAGGVVWLHGRVSSEALKAQVETLARTTEGVVAVRNRLNVAP